MENYTASIYNVWEQRKKFSNIYHCQEDTLTAQEGNVL